VLKFLQEYYFLWSLQAHQLSLKSERARLWTVMIPSCLFCNWSKHINVLIGQPFCSGDIW
jgi:hypothetical protein